MFSSVARLRLSIASALLLLSFTKAHENSLFTSSVSYCSPPETLLIQQFDVAYIKKNASINFNISAASVLPNVSVSANLFVNVYGTQPFNISLDLCSVLGGALCPLPTYNFTGSDSITLPPSINVASRLPGIAWIIPDIEAFAQLTLTDVTTGKVRACVQSTISNGWSTHQKAVEWTTGGMTLAALVSAIAQSHVPGALAPIRLLDIIYLFQTIAASALLGLDYPSVFRAFATNFSWALGLFVTVPTSSMQQTINTMRQHTGGTLANGDDGGNPISLVNRKLSPFNVPSRRSLAEYASVEPLERPQVLADVATVTAQSSNVLQAGVPIYVNTIGIATANAFMTVFFTWLILVAITLGALALGYGIILALRRTSWNKDRQPTLDRILVAYPSWARAWGLRIAFISLFPILIFVFWQWTLKDSWVSILLSVVTLLIISSLVLSAFYFLFRRTQGFREDISSRSLEPITAPYRSPRSYTSYIFTTAVLAKAMIIAFGHTHGLLQAILILITETFLLVALVVLRPHRTRGADALTIFLAVIRMVCAGLLIAFAESLALAAIPRVVVGIISAVIWSVTVIVMFFNMLVNMGVWRLLAYLVCYGRRQRGRRLSSKTSSDNLSSGDDEKQIREKNIGVTVTPASSWLFKRPSNPSPTHTPASSSAHSPITASSAMPSVYTNSTETSTVGELLPRRWSFQHSRPPSGSTSAASPSAGTFSMSTPPTPSSALGITNLHNLPPPREEQSEDEHRT
ncbi:hypothetical protein EUX98_g5535 [Antrodiella citrinella]|uniref:ML-like domain-containing protein n=1 Tax=Antrodiella citrinella TaxID=2447956 RepID=A0A4S4MU27_9APHY|nr:hypothetical protein EUX98_g5535 [Antrodiella citrinella]